MAGLVVLHVSDDPKDVTRGLAAAELIASQEPMRVQVIVNGPAVAGLLTDSAADGFNPREGVRLFACVRAMEGMQVTLADLARNVDTVPSAVIALATAQHEGAAYIRI